jgi:DNA mismatch repair protein MutS
MCIWIDRLKTATKREQLFCGIAVVNIFTGVSSIFQYNTPYQFNATVFDELERHISVQQPSEIIMVSPFTEEEVTKVVQYSGIVCPTIHQYKNTDTKVERCATERYLTEIISSVFTRDTYTQYTEFREHVFATQAFCFLLNFIQEHTPVLVKRIALPEFNNTSDRLVLANHTLKQLNILPDQGTGQSGQYSSVLTLLNKCCSAMGKRLFQEQLTSPVFCEEWLQKEYDMTGSLLSEQQYGIVENLRRELRQVRDVDKLARQIVMRRMYPSSLCQLYKTLEIVARLQDANTPENGVPFCRREFTPYLCNDLSDDPLYIREICHTSMSFLDGCLNIDLCRGMNSMTTFDENIIQTGVSAVLDEKVRQWNENKTLFQTMKDSFNKMIQQKEKLGTDVEYVKTHDTDKSGSQLQITAKRSIVLKQILHDIAVDGKAALSPTISIQVQDIKFVKTSASSSTVSIQYPLLDKVCRDMVTMKDEINYLIAETYQQVLQNLEQNHLVVLQHLGSYIARLDVLQCKAYIAKQYHYCCPTIVSDAATSFVEAVGLRHCLIEHLQKNELYVTNDVALDPDTTNGLLLYGTNAVGKTSLIRAMGISVVMAQAGLYVPCSEFKYKPYTAIFSRILATDNLFKGLSTFAVEMSELRVILRMANDRSLVLGDELCSGTETESALSIFVAGLMDLHAKGCSFIFATHFHEIVHYDEIRDLRRLSMKHMAVYFDRERDCLVYDRRLRDGSGPRMYGLEVCKSLNLGDDFLECANQIRNKYYPETQGILSQRGSRYNAEKIRGMCEKCGIQVSSEVHHLLPQKDADADGFIGGHHKNHPANLMNLCESCHHETHNSQGSEMRRKTTKGYHLVTSKG